MPTYEYECSRCGLVFEEFKPISAPRRERCPECRGRVQRLVSGGMGVVFKGSGFYRTDSRAKTKDGAAKPAADGGDGAAKTDGAAPAAPAAQSAPAAADKTGPAGGE